MEKHLIKNVEFSKVFALDSLIEYNDGQVISRTLSQGKNSSMTLFSFDKGEGISTHSSDGDAFVYIIDGEAEITIDNEVFSVKQGETIVMPAGIPHGLVATERFKMLLVVVFNQ